MAGQLALLEDLLAAALAELGLVLALAGVLPYEVPRCHKVAALVVAMDGEELTRISMGFESADLEDLVAAVGPVTTLHIHIVNHVAHYPVDIFNLEVPLAAVGTLMLSLSPDIHALPAEASLA
jgi:hypothetical protein